MAETFDVVFRGGAVKGVAFVGALKQLTQGGHKTRRLVGTSAGLIFALPEQNTLRNKWAE